MGVAGRFEPVDGGVKERRIAALVAVELALLVFGQELGVLLVGEVVGGEVFGREGKGLIEVGLPEREVLPRDGEHEIEAEISKSRFAQGLEGGDGVVGRVVPSKGLEDGGLEGLHSETDAVDPELPHQLCLVEIKGRGIGLHRVFSHLLEIEAFGESAEEPLEQGRAEQARRAAAEIDRPRCEGGGSAPLGLGENGIDEIAVRQIAGRVFVEAAVGTEVVAEGDVEVEMHVRTPWSPAPSRSAPASRRRRSWRRVGWPRLRP